MLYPTTYTGACPERSRRNANGMRVRKETGANWSEYIYFGSEVLTELATAPGLTSSALSQSGLSAFNPSVIVDGGTVCCGWHTDTATAGAFLRADLGAPAAVASVRIYASTPGYAGNYSIQRSDDNSNWTTVATFAPNAAGWNTVKWVQVTAHRYWRLHLNNTPGSGSWLNELQFGVWTDYIFAGGKRVAKAPGVAATSGTQYYHSDHLGSARLMTDASGNPVAGSEATFLPFGQEYSPTTAGNHYKFTGKERDSESGNDYFGARYYGSTMGRFLTPDAPFADQHLTDPQSWNLYTYVTNQPLGHTDPSGRGKVKVILTGGDIAGTFVTAKENIQKVFAKESTFLERVEGFRDAASEFLPLSTGDAADLGQLAGEGLATIDSAGGVTALLRVLFRGASQKQVSFQYRTGTTIQRA